MGDDGVESGCLEEGEVDAVVEDVSVGRGAVDNESEKTDSRQVIASRKKRKQQRANSRQNQELEKRQKKTRRQMPEAQTFHHRQQPQRPAMAVHPLLLAQQQLKYNIRQQRQAAMMSMQQSYQPLHQANQVPQTSAANAPGPWQAPVPIAGVYAPPYQPQSIPGNPRDVTVNGASQDQAVQMRMLVEQRQMQQQMRPGPVQLSQPLTVSASIPALSPEAASVRYALDQATGLSVQLDSHPPHHQPVSSDRRSEQPEVAGPSFGNGAGHSDTDDTWLRMAGTDGFRTSRIPLSTDDTACHRSEGVVDIVLDLDLTLVSSTRCSDISNNALLNRIDDCLEQTRTPGRKEGRDDADGMYSIMGMMWTKLRPGCRQFLKTLAAIPNARIHAVTNGEGAYAEAVVKVLDPTHCIFGDRVLARSISSLGARDKTLSLAHLGIQDDATVLMVDDDDRVWPRHGDNVITVERYLYFPSSSRSVGACESTARLSSGVDEHPEHGILCGVALPTLLGLCESVRAAQGSGGPPDVRDALRSVQKQVLNGVTILFSGCFAKEDQSETEDARQRSRISPLWKLAEKFGARCVLDPSDDVTHVVCQRPWTDKYKWARSLSTPKPTVSPGWLICSATLYRKADAEQFCV